MYEIEDNRQKTLKMRFQCLTQQVDDKHKNLL